MRSRGGEKLHSGPNGGGKGKSNSSGQISAPKGGELSKPEWPTKDAGDVKLNLSRRPRSRKRGLVPEEVLSIKKKKPKEESLLSGREEKRHEGRDAM